MPWTPSSVWIEEFNRPETDKIIVVLSTIDHPDLVSPLRFAHNTQDIASGPGGETFTSRMFELSAPGEKRGEVASGRYAVDDVDRAVISAIGELVGPPTVRIQVVRWDAPSTVEIEWLPLQWTRISWDYAVEGTLELPPALRQRRPAHSYTPGIAPGLFRI